MPGDGSEKVSESSGGENRVEGGRGGAGEHECGHVGTGLSESAGDMLWGRDTFISVSL